MWIKEVSGWSGNLWSSRRETDGRANNNGRVRRWNERSTMRRDMVNNVFPGNVLSSYTPPLPFHSALSSYLICVKILHNIIWENILLCIRIPTHTNIGIFIKCHPFFFAGDLLHLNRPPNSVYITIIHFSNEGGGREGNPIPLGVIKNWSTRYSRSPDYTRAESISPAPNDNKK